MAFGLRALVFSSLLAFCIFVSSATAATECETRKAACDFLCRADNAVSDFKCDEQNGAISSSCACAASGSSSSSSSSSSIGSDSSNTTPPAPAQATEPVIPASTTCEEKAKACQASCPQGTSAQFDCKTDETKSASAAADSCVCSPAQDSSNTSNTTTNPSTPPPPSQGTTIAPVSTGVTDPKTGLPAQTAGTERSATTVVNSANTVQAWKVRNQEMNRL
jgi:hypothetical protein